MNIIIQAVVVLKELIFNSFYFGMGVVVLKELIFNSFYFWEEFGSLKIITFLTVSTLGRCGSLERTDF